MNELHDIIGNLLPYTQQLLTDLIRYPSTPGNEEETMACLQAACSTSTADVQRVMLTDAIKDDPEYSDPIPDLSYDGRFNLRIVRAGAGENPGRTLLLNTHLDVVPASEGMTDAFEPRVEDGVIWGRGACDAKGQAATVWLVLKALDALNARTDGDLIVHFVVEEENGGNGTLAMVRHGEQADGCIVLEPSDGKLLTSVRGAVWFRLKLFGKAGHSGQAGRTRSALLMARDAIAILENYHADLLERSRGLPLFDIHPNPMPITFGKLEAGNWPATAPSSAVVEGVLGLLPNTTRDEVVREMRRALLQGGLTESDFELSFMYRHDASVLEPTHAMPQTLAASARDAGHPLEVAAMTASCDAWSYNNLLDIPTVVYGPGTLGVAHSVDERIEMAQIAVAAEILVRTILAYCGAAR